MRRSGYETVLITQPMRHGVRGGGRGRNSHWNNVSSSRGSTAGPPANVWTPAIAAAASQQLALRQAAPVTTAAPVSTPAEAAGPAVAVVTKHVESATMPPSVKARASIRKAAETVEASSKQSAADMELHLQQVESRLKLVKAQEEEVRAIVDAHLEREAALKRLLEELYREQQQQEVEDVKSVTSDQNAHGDPADSEMEQGTPDPPAFSVEATSQNTLPQPHQQQQGEKSGPVATVAPSTPGKQGDVPGSSSGVRRVSPIPRAGGVGADSAAASVAPPGGGSGSSSSSGGASGVPGLLLAMAMSMGGPGDGVLTREASTIEDYILLMSESQGLAKSEDDGDSEVDGSSRTEALVRCQPGLSLSEALDRAEAASARPSRPANLLALAALVRPSTAGASVTARKSQSAFGLGKRKVSDGAQMQAKQQQQQQQPSGDMVSESGPAPELLEADAVAMGDGGSGQSPTAPTAGKKKRRRLDPNGIMCPFELNGVCNDDNCEYQHAESYLPPTSASDSSTKEVGEVARGAIPAKDSEGDHDKDKAESSGKGLSPVGTEAAAAAASSAKMVNAAVPRWELPAIDFEASGDGGSEGWRKKRQVAVAKRSRSSGEGEPPAQEDVAATVKEVRESVNEGSGGTGAPGMAGRGSSSSDRKTEDGEDFLALETGIVAASSESVSGRGDASTNETTVDDVGDFLGRASPEDLAKAFARAASIANAGGGGGSRRGTGGQEERYYKDGEEGLLAHVDSGYGDGAVAANALTEEQVNALESRLEEAPCNVEGWLLVALHRLPREGNSAIAVLNTIGAVARGPDGPLGNADHAALKPALRTLVQGLERGQAETLWILYLRLFAILPGKENEAMGMAEHALENYPASRRIWRLYRVMLRRSGRRSLLDETETYRRHVDMLLQLRPLAAGAVPADRGAADAAVPPVNGVQGNDDSIAKSVEERDSATVGMVAYLVLERCSVLSEAGYVLQAAADALDALGEVKVVRGWNAAAEDGAGGKPLLRAPSRSGHSGGLEGRSIHGRLPEDVVMVLRRAPRGTRCLIWLTALHLLVMGVFPRPVLGLAEEGGCSDQGRDSHGAGLLWWAKELLSPESAAGVRLSTSAELRDAATKTFMSALQDAGLLPAEDGRGGGWAPPMRVRDALLPSSAEVEAARAGGMAPEPSALAGPSLALALNWLTFCCRREHGSNKGVRSVALACCRRFQLSRPDHPSTLEHLLLEHDVSRSRSLEDVYREISRAFSKEGLAAEALRERGGEPVRSEDSGSGNQAFLSPSMHQLQGLYCFLRFAEVRLRAMVLRAQVHVSPRPSPSTNSSATAVSQAADASELTAKAQREIEIGCDLLREALVEMWTPVWASKPDSGRGNGASGRWLLDDNGESLRLALEGAKASLSRWADGVPPSDGRADEKQAAVGGAMVNILSNADCRVGEDDALSAGRQLSSISYALWVLGGPSETTRALDHLLSAESFAKMPPERRRLAWLQRLEAALIISDQEAATAVDPMQGVREVVLRALADPRTEHRPDYATIADLLLSALDRSSDGGSLNVGGRMAENVSSSAASFAYDVLMLYAKGFREVRGGVDWVVVAESLGNGDRRASANKAASCGSLGIPAGASSSSACVRALLLWVNWADESEPEHGSARRGEGASALRKNARPYAEMALARRRDDTDLAGIVAALEASMGRPDRAQRTLESALSRNGLCSTLWEQRIALEAAFGRGSKDRARVTSLAAASKEVLLRLRCVGDGVKIGSGRSDPLSERSSRQASVLPARVAGRMLATVSNSSLRQETRSLSLHGALLVPDKTGTLQDPSIRLPAEVPQSLFLLKGLVNLSLASNGLVALPSAVGSLAALRSLDVSNNALTALPRSLSKLSGSLRLLRMAENRLTSPLSSSIGDLVSLRLLDLENNALTRFPEELVMGLKELRTLKLAGNHSFQRAPSSLTDTLPHLEQLTLP